MRFVAGLLVGLALWVVRVTSAEEELADPQSLDAVFRLLDSDEYEARLLGATRLEELAMRADQQPQLALRISELLLAPETSFEVRSQLESIQRRLPARVAGAPAAVGLEDLDRLLRDLNGPTYALRVSASAQIAWLAGQSESCVRVMEVLKSRLADPELSGFSRRECQQVWRTARAVWLASDPAGWSRPDVSREQIEAWLDDVTHDEASDHDLGRLLRAESAERELLDLLAFDAEVSRVQERIAARLPAGTLGNVEGTRLERLLELTRPAMVAEYWESRQHLGIQHLLIGVPAQADLAVRPSHFDFINDQQAHCVSGNALSPGDYPVGSYFPHPNPEKPASQFLLINLPTPRRRMLYEYQVHEGQARRLTRNTESTAAYFLARNQPLSLAEINMLRSLDQRVVSRLAGQLLLKVADAPLVQDPAFAEVASHHEAICQVLIEIGTSEALDDLLSAIRQGRFSNQSGASRVRREWIALLAISDRDLGSLGDSWLLPLIEEDETLNTLDVEGAEVGACVAAILLKRRGLEPSEYGLTAVHDDFLARVGCPSCRFATIDARKRVRERLGE